MECREDRHQAGAAETKTRTIEVNEREAILAEYIIRNVRLSTNFYVSWRKRKGDAEFPQCALSLQEDSYRPVKARVGCNLSKGRALMAAARRLTSTTITTPGKGVNHIMRDGYSALDTI